MDYDYPKTQVRSSSKFASYPLTLSISKWIGKQIVLAVALVFLILGTVYVPLPIANLTPNLLSLLSSSTTQKQQFNDQLEKLYRVGVGSNWRWLINVTGTISPLNTNASDIVANIPLLINISLDVPVTMVGVYNISQITVRPDNALTLPMQQEYAYLPNSQPAFSSIPMAKVVGANPWVGSREVEYSVAGTYGLSIDFLNVTTWHGVYVGANGFTMHTRLLFSINSLRAERDNDLTFGLTFFILFFAVMNIYQQINADRNKNNRNAARLKANVKTNQALSTYH